MGKGRLEAFSDGVVAIIITIMVLELHPPKALTAADLQPLAVDFLTYLMSFVTVGIYWNNHHHMLHAAERVNGAVLWANMHLLFWLSLIPFATGWMGENHFAPLPTALYGVALLMPAIAYTILQTAIVALHGRDGTLARALGRDFKGKMSVVLYLAAIALSFVAPWAAQAIYVGVALMWLVPDRRIERVVRG